MFSVFSFQFQQNKFYPNRPESPVQKCGFPRFGAENATSKIFTKHKILGLAKYYPKKPSQIENYYKFIMTNARDT